MPRYFSTGELARRLGKCRETINYWIKTGRLKPSLVIQNRSFFTEEDILNFERENQKGLPNNIAA